MSMQLYLTYGSTTLDFQADGYKLIDGFFPETPDEGKESVSDQFNVLIKGSTGADLHAKITAMRLAFEHARRHKDDAQAARIYYGVDTTEAAWMSRLLGGTIIYNDKLGRNWRHHSVIATIIIERKPYWDAKNEVQVPLTNGNGTNNITGLTVYNHDDAGASPYHDNWVEIAAADVLGDMPGPTRLELINNYATARLYTAWIGQNWTDPDNLAHILEAEDSTGGTDKSDSGCSGGYYSEYILASGAETEMFTWSLGASLLDACKGQYYKIMARFVTGAPTSVKFRLKLKYAATTIWQSGQITLDATRSLQIRDMFTLRLPPWLLGQIDLSALSLILTGQQITGSPVYVEPDFLQITPLDGWRMLECAGYGVVQNERMIDDGMNGNSYIDNGAGDNKVGIVVGYGSPIELYPGKKQRLYILMHSNTANTAEILRTISAKLYYHPRRQTL